MKIMKKCIFVLFLGCIAASVTACGQKVTTDSSAETNEMLETVATSKMESEMTTTTAVTTSISETTATTTTSTLEETTQTTTTTTTLAETTTTTVPPAMTTAPPATTTTMPVTAPPAETATAAATAPNDEAVELFDPGIWEASSSNGSRYFCFDTSSSSGSFRDQENGLGMGFTYELKDENTVVFHMGTADDTSQATVRFSADALHATLNWENGSTETFSYLGLGNFTTFHFYSNVDLCEMALNYYEKQTGYRPGDAEAQIQEDGLITIQLYDNMGDHNSTSAWYTVDKYTAKGTDLTGNAIDLTKTE